eukprot:2389499-Rhodomonas_salina.3
MVVRRRGVGAWGTGFPRSTDAVPSMYGSKMRDCSSIFGCMQNLCGFGEVSGYPGYGYAYPGTRYPSSVRIGNSLVQS